MTRYIRRFSQPHCVVALAHDLFASPIQKLSQPPNTAHKEAGVDVEEDDSRVAVGILPVGKKRHLSGQRTGEPADRNEVESWVMWFCLTRVKNVQRRVMVPK